ncbi:hypothetical protein DXG01_011298 [Tephrocybe rancida]|nr:hypothetical protein DXG01_011298 [Tephrocybe rancida]
MIINIEPFWGDNRADENAQDFIRGFNHVMAKENDAYMLRQFPNYLHSGSIADEWFDKLAPEDKASWAVLEQQFNTRWPKAMIATKTLAEYKQEIVAKVLKEEQLGTTVMFAGRPVHAHVAWANEMTKLTTEAGVYNGGSQISHEKAEAVRKKKAEAERERAAVEKQLRELETPRTVLSRTLANMTLGTATVAPATGTTLFPAHAQRNTAAAAQGTPCQVTDADCAAFHLCYNTLPQHPATDAGRTAHGAQQCAWVTQHGLGAQVTEHTPYPLRPGTSKVNNGECFRCGISGRDHPGRGHISSNCPKPQDRQLHPNKQQWRAICSNMLREPREVAVRLVVVDDYGTGEEVVGGGDEQGKGEGPSD